jgi:hypothetical protein
MAMTAKAPLSLDRYVVEPLMRDLVGHDRKPSAYLIYLAILGQNESGVRAMSYQELADFTGLSRRSVQDAVAHLAGRKLIEVQRVGPTETAVYRALMPWRR